MRRSEREITDMREIINALDECGAVRVAFQTGGAPYIVPLCFGYEYRDDRLRLFFHSAREGRKLDLLRANPAVGFEADHLLEITPGAEPCRWTARYVSVVGTGVASVVESKGEKKRAMDLIMRKYRCEGPLHYFDAALDSTALIALDVETISGKRNL